MGRVACVWAELSGIQGRPSAASPSLLPFNKYELGPYCVQALWSASLLVPQPGEPCSLSVSLGRFSVPCG